ncbi:MAG: hypothetical protein KDJ29_17305 [Hyphomicrobiales bacterium]|nr:hypothetical protein [Hyphomicrobiales bacterium]
MSALEIITTAMCDAGLDNVQDDDADYLLTALETAGYRLIPPGQLDLETIEKCAAECDRIDNECGMEAGLAGACADAIRALGAERHEAN